MKILAVALLLILSLVTLFAAARADALSQPSIQPLVARPAPLPEGDDDKKDDKDDDEEDEEEYRGLSSRAALELVPLLYSPVVLPPPSTEGPNWG